MPIALVALCKHFCSHVFITPFKSEPGTCESSCPYYGLKRQQHICAYGTWKATNVRVWTNIKHPPTEANPGLFSKSIHQFYVPGSAPEVHAHHDLLKVTLCPQQGSMSHRVLSPTADQQEQWQFQSPPHTRTAKQVSRGNIQVSLHLSQIHCQIKGIMLILHF